MYLWDNIGVFFSIAELDLGSSCEVGQCRPNNSVCDSTTNNCECQELFFDSNGTTAGGDCSASSLMFLIISLLSLY